MKKYNSLSPIPSSKIESLHVYNGMDVMLTLEIFTKLGGQLDGTILNPPHCYNFERALQGPVLEMMLRGVRVDMDTRDSMIIELQGQADMLTKAFEDIIAGVFSYVGEKKLDKKTGRYSSIINSTKFLPVLFYEWLGLPVQYKMEKGMRKVSCDRVALEKLSLYPKSAIFCKIILAQREAAKKVGTLRSGVDSDLRFRASYNIAGTETGRFSSNKNAFGTGSNFQNITEELRHIFVSDKNMKMAYIDLEQAESRLVGLNSWLVSGKSNYLDACEGGDLHTTVATMVWPDLIAKEDLYKDGKLVVSKGTPFGDDKKINKGIADLQKFYSHFSYRDMAKRGGHGCLTADHEVLTPTGWVSIAAKPATIMQWDNGICSFTHPSHWEDKEWSGTFVNVEGTALSLCMTSDHRVLYKKDANTERTHEVPAEHFPTKGIIPLGGEYSGQQHEPLAELVAAFQCDGHQKSTNRVEFHFHKERKKLRLCHLAEQAGITYNEVNNKITLHWNCPYPKQAGAYLLNWNSSSLHAYITEHKMWDGWQGDTSTTISSIHKEHLEWLQTIGRLCGIGGNINKAKTSGFGSIVYTLQQNKRKYATCSSLKIQKQQNKAQVYCPTVASSYFLVRRNGKISVTGNTNYNGQPFTMAKNLHVEKPLMESFQNKYFSSFPEIKDWHRWVRAQIQLYRKITTPLGFTRQFFGRPDDESTIREAIAFSPQSSIGMLMNYGMLKLWEWKNEHYPQLSILAQIHDALLITYPELPLDEETALITKVKQILRQSIHINGREFSIPTEAMVGWNWSKYSKNNEDGLKVYSPNEQRTRKHTPTGLLD